MLSFCKQFRKQSDVWRNRRQSSVINRSQNRLLSIKNMSSKCIFSQPLENQKQFKRKCLGKIKVKNKLKKNTKQTNTMNRLILSLLFSLLVTTVLGFRQNEIEEISESRKSLSSEEESFSESESESEEENKFLELSSGTV